MNNLMKRLLLGLIIIALLASFLVLFYSLSKRNRRSSELTLYGNVDVRQVDIGFRVQGQVSNLYFEEGDFVPKGSLMAILDQTPYDNELAQAKANLETIKANMENAVKLLKRRQDLIGIGGVSKEDLDNSAASYDELKGSFSAAEAALAIAQDNLRFTKVYAPTDGIILTRIREPGTVVRVADPVYTLSVSSPVWIRAFVDEPELGDVYFGMEAEVLTDTPDAPNYKGKVGFISPIAEFTPKTVQTASLRTDLVYRLRIYVDNPDRRLKQGMPVTVRLKIGERDERRVHDY